MLETQLPSRENDERAVDAAFCECYIRLVAWCRRHVWRGLGDPEDFVHQAYLRSRRCWAEVHRSAEREEAYFFKSLRWVVADAIRKQGREREGLDRVRRRPSPASAEPVHGVIAEEALRALTPHERVVCAGLMNGRTEGQLCAEFSVSRAALAVRMCRARQKLRRFLGVT